MKRIHCLAALFLLTLIPQAYPDPSRPSSPPRPAGPRRVEDRQGPRPPDRKLVVDRYLSRLKETDPEEYQRQSKLREEDPQAFRKAIRERVRRRRPEREHKPGHPLQEEIEAVRSAGSQEEKTEAVGELRAAVSRMVDENLERRAERIQSVERQLEQLKARHQQEKTRREELVRHHVERILTRLNESTDLPDSESRRPAPRD